jgi:hypothetical protein
MFKPVSDFPMANDNNQITHVLTVVWVIGRPSSATFAFVLGLRTYTSILGMMAILHDCTSKFE